MVGALRPNGSRVGVLGVALGVMMTMLLVLGATASPAEAAFKGGGTAPSKAPTIAWGQHYEAEIDNHKETANFGGRYEAAFWRLPPVGSRDELIVNWHSVPSIESSGRFPVCMRVAQGITDSTWGEDFEDHGYCNDGFGLSGSGTAASKVTIQENDASGSTYLEFWVRAEGVPSCCEKEQNFPYDFTVEAPRHYLSMTLAPFTEVPANGVVTASVADATGAAPPDGLNFGLTVRWPKGGIATYSGISAGGHVAFQLALPESAVKKNASFVAGRGADGGYQLVESPLVRAKVAPPMAVPQAPVSVPCRQARTRVRVLGRQHHRLAKNARYARGHRRAKLRRRARGIAVKLRKAKAAAAAVCA